MSKEIPTYPLLIEESSNYAFTVRRMQKPLSFDRFRDTSNKFYNDLPEEIRDELHESILRGTCMLSNEPELNAYMRDMGKMHNAKLRKAFDSLSDNFYKADCIDVIDYGCGQGLGIIALADHFREDFIHIGKEVRRIVLIEPSEMALKRAALHASVLFPKAKLVTINKGFDDLVAEDIVSDAEVMTLHILSNVLDLAKTDLDPKGYFDLNRFADLISANLEGENQFVGIEPWFNYDITDEKFPRFWKRVGISKDFKLICNKGEFVAGKNWTCVIVCGEKNNLNLFQKLSKEYVEVGEMSEDAICVSQVGFYRGGCCHAEPVLKYGFVDKSGNKIILCEFSAAENFRNGLAFVENGYDEYAYWPKYNWGAINKQGEIVIPFIYESIKWADNDEYIIASVEDRIDKYDKSGNLMDAEGRVIEYTSTNGRIVEPNSIDAFDAKIISNTYKNGVGKIVFDKPITEIGSKVFKECKTLKSIIIPEGVERIGKAAFYNCIALEDIEFPASVRFIEKQAFDCWEEIYEDRGYSFNSINRVDIKSLSSWCQIEFANEGANPISHGAKLYINGYELNDLIIPENISQIKNYAFAGCLSLKNINITNNIISIGKRAFWRCRNLESTVINKNVKALGELAFQECSGTLYIDCNIPDARMNAYYICCANEIDWYDIGGRGPFYECWGPLVDNNFSEILLGSNARYIGDGAFCRSNKLERLVIPEGIKSIKSNTFSSCSCLKQIVIPKSVTKIEDYAFSDCQSLVEITIPEGIVKIEHSTFLNCKSLKSLEIPDSVTEIGPDVFYGCESLVFVKLGESLSYIDLNDPFWGCNSLESVYLSSKCMARVKQHMENVMITEEDMEYCHRWYKLLVVDDDMMQDTLDVKNNTTNNPVVEMINGMEVRLGTKVGQGVIIGKSSIENTPQITEDEPIDTVESTTLQLYPQQQQALDAICEFIESDSQVFILKGYAGTGKTTMIKALLPLLHNMGKHTTLMAPTGRAAKVLMTKTRREASTIHRTIYSVNKLTSVRHDENGELIKMVDYIYKDKEETRKHDVVEFWFGINQERYADYNPQNAVYIVDEASMVSSRKTSNELFHFGSDVLLDDLLEYAELLKGGKIIFIGDPAQLPPVGDNCSAALSEEYFKENGIGVTSFELTDVVRQAADSIILENAMMLRDLLQTQPRNTLTFKRCDNEVEDVLATTMVAKYIEMYPEPAFGDTAIICYSNKMTKGYNDAIRTYYYPEEKSVQAGDILQVVKNYYRVDDPSQSRDALYNGDFVRVLDVSSEVETQSAPVWTKPGNKREVISLAFRDVTVQSEDGNVYKLKIIDSLLNSTNPSLTPNEHTALYINFRMRNPNLPKDKEAQAKMLMEDPYYNALNVKYGYAITGHKSQGGDWDTVFVDYNGRTGLDNDSLRWMYTATTRAKERLYGVNMPNIQPFDKLQFRPITKLNKPAANAQIVGNVGNVDMLSSNASNSQKAKCLSVISALSRIGCRVDKIEQLQYKDRYHIRVSDVIERYDCTYNGAGYYTTYNALDASENSKAIIEALQSEECYTYQFDYSPSHKVLVDLHAKMRSICDELGVSITNIVEDIKQYNVVYFLKTTGKYSYIKFYFDKNMFVTYGHPYSDIEAEDVLLNEIIAKLS